MLHRDVCFGLMWHRHSQRLAHYSVHSIKWQNNFKQTMILLTLAIFPERLLDSMNVVAAPYERWARLFWGIIPAWQIRWIMLHMWAHKNQSCHTFITCLTHDLVVSHGFCRTRVRAHPKDFCVSKFCVQLLKSWSAQIRSQNWSQIAVRGEVLNNNTVSWLSRALMIICTGYTNFRLRPTEW